jgi:TonB family protein
VQGGAADSVAEYYRKLSVGGVQGGIQGGVIGGVPGGVPSEQRARFDEIRKSQSHIAKITVVGLSDAARDELLARLPVHEGDTVTFDQVTQVQQAIHAFDEHLTMVLMAQAGERVEKTMIISAPSPVGMQEARRAALDGAPPPPPPPPGLVPTTPPDRIKIGGNMQAAKIVSNPAPVYPQLAKSARVSGVVHLAVLIAKDGTVQELHSLGGPALLIQAAMEAVKQWVYQPTFLNGEPTAVETTVDVNFTLNQ